MSLRDLARQHLEAMAKQSLSGVRTHRVVRPGQNDSVPCFSTDEVCPDASQNPDKLFSVRTARPVRTEWIKPDKPDASDSSDKPDKSDKVGAAAYDPVRLQREADRRNARAAWDGITDRWCACGRFATFAWPGDDRRPVWRCLECGPAGGVA